MNAISTKIANINEATLKEMAIALFVDDRPEAGDVLSSVLDRLMQIMPEPNFVSFCDEIGA